MNFQVREGARIELEVVTDRNHQSPMGAVSSTQVTQLWGERRIMSAVVHPGLSHICLFCQLSHISALVDSNWLNQEDQRRDVPSTKVEPSVSFTNRS